MLVSVSNIKQKAKVAQIEDRSAIFFSFQNMSEVNPAQDATINRRMTLVRQERHQTRRQLDQNKSETIEESLVVEEVIIANPLAAGLNFMLSAGLPSILSGYTSGICGLLVGHPFDSLKVLLQATPPTAESKPIRIATSTVPPKSSRFTKFLSLYAGIGPPMLTVGLVQSVNFFCYDTLRRTLYYSKNPKESSNDNASSLSYLYNDTIWNVVLSSAITGSFLSIFTSPFQALKTQQQLNPSWSLRHIIQQNRQKLSLMQMLYVGYPAHFVCEVFGRATYLGSYESIKRLFVSKRDNHTDLSLKERMICASSAGILSWSAVYPMDVVRTNMYALQSRRISTGTSSSSETPVPTTTRCMIQQMYQTGGIRAFSRGYLFTIIRAGPVAAVVLPVYDVSLLWFHKTLN